MKRLAVFVVLAAAGLSSVITVAQAGDAGTAHLPDLVTLPPSELRLETNRQAGTKTLRFSNAVANLGRGRLEVRPVNNPANGTTVGYQRVYTHDGAGNWSLQSEFPIGTFEFHPSHNHWHFGGFSLYELRNRNLDGSIGRKVLRSSGKVSFCMVDSVPVNVGLEHASPSPGYGTCNQTANQGLSVGWADVYGWSLPGQSIDVSGLPNGTYWLVSTADPENRITEINNHNNRGAVKVTIIGSRLVLPQ
jgi:hypothetical protein